MHLACGSNSSPPACTGSLLQRTVHACRWGRCLNPLTYVAVRDLSMAWYQLSVMCSIACMLFAPRAWELGLWWQTALATRLGVASLHLLQLLVFGPQHVHHLSTWLYSVPKSRLGLAYLSYWAALCLALPLRVHMWAGALESILVLCFSALADLGTHGSVQWTFRQVLLAVCTIYLLPFVSIYLQQRPPRRTSMWSQAAVAGSARAQEQPQPSRHNMGPGGRPGGCSVEDVQHDVMDTRTGGSCAADSDEVCCSQPSALVSTAAAAAAAVDATISVEEHEPAPTSVADAGPASSTAGADAAASTATNTVPPAPSGASARSEHAAGAADEHAACQEPVSPAASGTAAGAARRPSSLTYQSKTFRQALSVKVYSHPGSLEQYGAALTAAALQQLSTLLQQQQHMQQDSCRPWLVQAACVRGCVQLFVWVTTAVAAATVRVLPSSPWGSGGVAGSSQKQQAAATATASAPAAAAAAAAAAACDSGPDTKAMAGCQGATRKLLMAQPADASMSSGLVAGGALFDSCCCPRGDEALIPVPAAAAFAQPAAKLAAWGAEDGCAVSAAGNTSGSSFTGPDGATRPALQPSRAVGGSHAGLLAASVQLAQSLPDAHLLGPVDVQCVDNAGSSNSPVVRIGAAAGSRTSAPTGPSAYPSDADVGSGDFLPPPVQLCWVEPPVLVGGESPAAKERSIMPAPETAAATASLTGSQQDVARHGEVMLHTRAASAAAVRVLLLGTAGQLLYEQQHDVVAGQGTIRLNGGQLQLAAVRAPTVLQLVLTPPLAPHPTGSVDPAPSTLVHACMPLLVLPAAAAAEMDALWQDMVQQVRDLSNPDVWGSALPHLTHLVTSRANPSADAAVSTCSTATVVQQQGETDTTETAWRQYFEPLVSDIAFLLSTSCDGDAVGHQSGSGSMQHSADAVDLATQIVEGLQSFFGQLGLQALMELVGQQAQGWLEAGPALALPARQQLDDADADCFLDGISGVMSMCTSTHAEVVA